MNKRLKIGFSSCPNDTFMFDALVNRKILFRDLGFEPIILDVEELNKLAINNELDVTKISYANYPQIEDNYQLLTSGSALGYNNGPLLVSKTKIIPDELRDVSIAIPGINTTANFLLGILFPEVRNKSPYLFSEIEDVVLSGEKDAGLLIHESRFTYEKKGLQKIADLGEIWEDRYNIPVPLGGIAIRRELSHDIKKRVNQLIKSSIEFAFRNPESSFPFVKSYAKELSEKVIRMHIDLYVTKFSVDIGKDGKRAIEIMFENGEKEKMFRIKKKEVFIDS